MFLDKILKPFIPLDQCGVSGSLSFARSRSAIFSTDPDPAPNRSLAHFPPPLPFSLASYLLPRPPYSSSLTPPPYPLLSNPTSLILPLIHHPSPLLPHTSSLLPHPHHPHPSSLIPLPSSFNFPCNFQLSPNIRGLGWGVKKVCPTSRDTGTLKYQLFLLGSLARAGIIGKIL